MWTRSDHVRPGTKSLALSRTYQGTALRILPFRTSLGTLLLCGERRDVRSLALCGVCRADGATVKPSNQFLPVTRPPSATGERERCFLHTQGGDASAWPPFCWIVAYKDRRENRDTQTMGRLVTQRSAQRGRPAVPDHWTGRPGGSGAQPPLHLIYMVKVGRLMSRCS